MFAIRSARTALLVATLLVAPAAFSADRASLERLLPAQGLPKVELPGFGVAYGRPGALAGFDSVLLEPVDVSFQAGWRPTRPGSALLVSSADRDKLRGNVVRWVHDAFAQTLQRRGIRLADAPGPGVLRVKLRVVDVNLSNPWADDATQPGARVVSISSGEMTLLGEFADARTGDVLARVADWEDMRPTERVFLPDSEVRTGAAVEAVASRWAASVAGALGRGGSRNP